MFYVSTNLMLFNQDIYFILFYFILFYFIFVASSRDGTIKLWNCGTSSTIATMGNYKFAINKMILTNLPSQYKPAKSEILGTCKIAIANKPLLNMIDLDPMEVDTADKLVLAALDDGSVHGIHLGTKKEVHTVLH